MKFELSEQQVTKFRKWSDQHKSVYTGAVGGRYEFSFLDTSIGTFVGVRDCVTDEVLDLSEI